MGGQTKTTFMKKNYCAVFVLLAIYSGAFSQPWTRFAVPHPDSSSLIEIDIPNAETIWANFQLGIYVNNDYIRSADGGVTWRSGTVTAANGTGFSNLMPLDSSTCYATFFGDTAKLGVYKTVNGGTTWQKLGAGTLYNATSFPDFTYFWNANRGVTVGDADSSGNMEIYTTTNAGVSWTRVPKANLPATPDLPYSFLNGYRVAGNRIWFLGAYGTPEVHKLYRSDDFGVHWTSYNAPFSSLFLYTFTNVNTGYAMSLDSGKMVYKTTNGGATWSAGTPYITTQPDILRLSNIPGTSTIIASSSHGMDFSNDGITWFPVDTKDHTGAVKFFNSSIGWSGEFRRLATNPGGALKWSNTFPVKLLSFNAVVRNNAALLTWRTAQELNNKGFYIEKSKDGESFSSIGFVAAKANGAGNSSYNYTDETLSGSNVWFYRLRQIDIDGKATFSNITRIYVTAVSSIQISPNPVKNRLFVQLNNTADKAEIMIYNSKGQQVYSRQLRGSTGDISIPMDNLQPGSYVVKVIAGNATEERVIIKQ